ncbi:DUF2637 domain-containing protein [Micromonospora zhanjiangensis]|uniref:DUF2637 domain-containing protein n=1 Tax=Micromonospora zhanjiangensis TaxID=1522057 RepID=A0ABV8KXY4_9ACTN
MSKQATSAGERVEGVVLVVIVITVGSLAGAASFTHVHDWTMANSPGHTGDWFGWANAAISELIPIAALLIIRRRRRTGGSIGYPMFLLIAAVILSLSAQLAVAKPGVSGWLLSAVPALAFLGLSKLVFSTSAKPEPAGESVSETDDVPARQTTTVSDGESVEQPARPVRGLVPVVGQHDLAAPVDQVRPVVEQRRPRLVPVPAAAFSARRVAASSQEG